MISIERIVKYSVKDGSFELRTYNKERGQEHYRKIFGPDIAFVDEIPGEYLEAYTYDKDKGWIFNIEKAKAIKEEHILEEVEQLVIRERIKMVDDPIRARIVKPDLSDVTTLEELKAKDCLCMPHK